jgi:hypothetical protein
MLPVGFEPTISAGERPQIYALVVLTLVQTKQIIIYIKEIIKNTVQTIQNTVKTIIVNNQFFFAVAL